MRVQFRKVAPDVLLRSTPALTAPTPIPIFVSVDEDVAIVWLSGQVMAQVNAGNVVLAEIPHWAYPALSTSPFDG